MIIKNYEIKNFINKKNIFLIYGENQGLKEDIIKELIQSYPKENIYKYNEKSIFINIEDFYSNIFSQSFFEKKKAIIINEATEKIKEEIETILEKNIKDITLILVSKILEKKSRLRNLFEKEKDLVCVPVYKDDNRTLLNIAYNFFKTKKINISTESINLIVERASEDRKNLKNELIKLENFIGERKKIDVEDLIKLTNLAENHAINKVVDLSLAKNTKQTIQVLNENIFSTDDVIILIRSFLLKSKRLLKLSKELERNGNIEQVISLTKPPIFWKDKDIIKRQMKIWTKKKLIELIQNINKVEIQLKKNTNSSINIIQDFIIEQSSKPNN